MTPSARRLSWFAGAAVLAFSVAIWFLASRGDELGPPDPFGRGVVSAVLLAVPGIIGWIGAGTGRRTVLVAAGVLCLFQSPISFGLVTLVYLVPAAAFLRSAVDRSAAGPAGGIRPFRVLAAVLAVPIALIVVFRLGILGVLLLVVLAGLAAIRRPRGEPIHVSGVDAVRGVTIVACVVGAWIASFALAETACWIGHGQPGGPITWERIPPTNSFTLGPNDLVGTCAGGTLTPAGAGVACGLVLLALATAALPRPRGRSGADAGQGGGHRDE